MRLREQPDGFNGLYEIEHFASGHYEEEKVRYEYSVFPSRSTHRIQIEEFGTTWLEIVAWCLRLNKSDGTTTVKPVSQFGTHDWDDVIHYQSPNLRKSQENW
jgi:hypothetical protein